MDFMSSFKKMQGVLTLFSGSSEDESKQPHPNRLPKGVYYGRLVARAVLLSLVLFIFVWWPADNYTPSGFDTWSERMDKLPQNVWYILISVILSWGATEAVGARSLGKQFPSVTPPMNVPAPPVDEFEMGMDAPPLDGRFMNLGEDDPMLNEPVMGNAVLEEWRANAPE